MEALKIGTRKSALALWQARWVQSRLKEAYPDMQVDLVLMDTKGDKDLDTPLPSVADKGFFTQEIERELFDGTIDIAVHSLKDLPTKLPEGLDIGAYCERADAHDAFIGKDNMHFSELPEGACIGTSSLRRVAQVKRLRPDVECVAIRGNLETRLRKMQESDTMSGTFLACAGMKRMGMADRITDQMPFDKLLPAPGQGVIAIEYKDSRTDVRRVIQAVNHMPSALEARTERAFLSFLEGGCQTPLGAKATFRGDCIEFEAGVFSLDGSKQARVATTGQTPEVTGKYAADIAMQQGADAILAEVRTS